MCARSNAATLSTPPPYGQARRNEPVRQARPEADGKQHEQCEQRVLDLRHPIRSARQPTEPPPAQLAVVWYLPGRQTQAPAGQRREEERGVEKSEEAEHFGAELRNAACEDRLTGWSAGVTRFAATGPARHNRDPTRARRSPYPRRREAGGNSDCRGPEQPEWTFQQSWRDIADELKPPPVDVLGVLHRRIDRAGGPWWCLNRPGCTTRFGRSRVAGLSTGVAVRVPRGSKP